MTDCGKIIRDHIKSCTTSSAQEVEACGEVCTETEVLYNKAMASDFLVNPNLRKGWNQIYGYDDNKINLLTFDLLEMQREERKALCMMITGFID